jgi:glycosyltransferase involved in cell wall biosynthesis
MDLCMRLAFIIPARLPTVAGGYSYNRHMIAGLRATGAIVDVHEIQDAVATWRALPHDAVPVIDGLALREFESLADALATRHCIGLIHHPMALDIGVGDAERARLRDVEQCMMLHLARIIVTSDLTATRLAAEFGVDPARIAVVTPGTADAPRSVGSGGPGCAILSVGALVPRKGHDVLMRALARLFDLDWHLTIAGAPRDPTYAQGLQALAEDLAIAQRVTFAGEPADAALGQLWQRADIFALATQYEGYGMAVAEAMKRGVPVAVTSGGAAASLVTPASGVVCEPGDIVTLSKSLRRLIFDTTLQRNMADAAWEIGQSLPDWTTQARAFANALT